MKATNKLLLAALAAAGIAVAMPADAAGGVHGVARSGSGHWTGGHSGHWSGGHSGHWSGGSHWRGGGHWHGGHWYGPRFAFYWGVPVAVGAWWWGYPYYYGYPAYSYYDYPAAPVYQEREVYPQGEISSAEAKPGPGAPTQGPLYMNYCESAKAYYPKVSQCPEGWKFIAPRER
jgi:hypothetical protein